MSLRRIALGTIFGMLFVIAFVLMAGNAAAADAPVTIDGNAAMATYASDHSLAGNGNLGDPYIIDGLVINANGAENGIVIKNVNVYLSIQNCVINNTHYVNSNIGSGDGIFISSSSNILLSNNHVNESYNGITVLNSQSIVVFGSTVHNVSKAGIKIAGSNNVQAYQNFCADSYFGLLSIQSTHTSKFDNNTCLRGTYGFYITGSYQNILSDNNVKGYVYGISIEAGSIGNRITLNNCSSNSYSGIFIFEDSNSVIANKVYSNGYSGIQVNQADDVVLNDNICINNPRGIYATGVNHLALNGNNCSRSSLYGFNANSCQNITTNGNNMFFNTQAGIFLNLCKNSYLWYDVIGQTTQYGFVVTQSSWIYTTATCTYNGNRTPPATPRTESFWKTVTCAG
jgi:parallel beta-helix repeat protein